MLWGFDAVSDSTFPKIDVEAYRIKTGCMPNEDGNPKYLYYEICLPNMSYGNPDPERDLSIRKYSKSMVTIFSRIRLNR